MKKLVASLLILVSILSLIGCSTKSFSRDGITLTLSKEFIASVIAENDLKPQKMLIVSSHRLAPAVAWTAKNDQVKIISDEKCCDRVILPEELKEIMKKNGTPVMLVLYSADKMWSQFSDNKNIKTVNGISFLLLD